MCSMAPPFTRAPVPYMIMLMQPSSPSPAPPPAPMPPVNQGPYDFIMKEDQKKPRFSFSGSKKQILFLSLAAVILIMIVFIAGALITSSGKSTTQTLVNLAEEQTELARVADIGVAKSRGSASKNLATTTKLAMQSSLQDTIALLKKQGHKLKTKELSLKRNAATDTTLNNAALNNNFDDTFLQIMQSQLKTYQTDVKQAFDASKSKNEKALLAASYNGMTVILAQPVAATAPPN